MRPPVRLAALLTATVAAAATAQIDRREQVKTPGLVLDAGGPTAAVRAMTYTADGKHLLAAGQDKVVFSWPARPDGTLDLANRTTLRWRTWHEWRGSIYALAVSPDETLVAVAGYGAIPAEVAVIDRATGKVVAGLEPPEKSSLGGETIWSLAFAPGGTELAFGTDHGDVWVWAYRAGKNAVRKVGGHGPRKGGPTNRVHRLAYRGADRLLSAAQDQRAVLWPAAGGPGKDVFRTVAPNANLSAATPDGGLLAFGGQDDARANVVEVVRADGTQPRTAELPSKAVPTALALSRDGRRLAVGVQLPPAGGQPHQPRTFAVWVFDVADRQLARRQVASANYVVDALAFTPDGNGVVVAGGEDFAVRVVALDPVKVRQAAASAGRPVWGVGFSADRSKLGIRTARNPAPGGFNDWAAGPWAVFDLTRRAWDRGGDFRPVAPVEELDGWRVQPLDQRRWQAVNGGRRFDLPLDYARDALPTCYTFLKPAGGGVKLAVGHLWGFTVFAVGPAGVRPEQVGYGHAGELTAIAPSPDHTLLLAAGRDQTVSCFSLAAWEHQPELGARFVTVNGKLFVDRVADGSPAWEAGLDRGDEVALLKVAGKEVSRADWAARLATPEPNRELFLHVRRRGLDGEQKVLTSVRRRPLWKFFPAADGEWVLWRWRDYFYDSSANGDAAVGWQVNGEVGGTPEFFRAEQFRRGRRNPDRVRETLTATVAQKKVQIVDLLPPKLELTLAPDRPAGGPVRGTVRVAPGVDGQVRQPSSVSLWLNDHKWKTWEGREQFQATFEIPPDRLRAGRSNTLVAQAFGQGDDPSRGDSRVQRLPARPAGPAAPRLHGLFVGVSDYSQAPPPPPRYRRITDLDFAASDARAVAKAWGGQVRKDLYEPGVMIELTHDRKSSQVSRAAILDALRRLAAEAAADDLVVVFLSGHGWADLSKGKADREYGSDAFAFVTPQFDFARPDETGLSSETLYDALIALPARKMVFLDTCHSGSVQQAEYVRGLTPEGLGPAVISAASRDELSWEFPSLGHGLFTRALLDALGADFASADRDADRVLDENELSAYIARRVPALLDKYRGELPAGSERATQRPQAHPRTASLAEPKSVARPPLPPPAGAANPD